MVVAQKGCVWFLVSLPLAWERQGRDRRFPVKILPYLYTARTRSVNEPLPWVRNTKIGNNMVPSEPPSCVGTPRSRQQGSELKSSLAPIRQG